MQTKLLLFLPLLLWAGCRATSNDGLVRAKADPLGSTVQSPFVTMIENARQPDPILGRIYFEYDKADLTESAKVQLDDIALQAARRNGMVIVEGYADHCNSDEYNIRLGYERALAAAGYLRSEGVWDERLVIHSFGESRPVTTNWKDLGRALNRCVVVRMYAQGEGAPGMEAKKSYRSAYRGLETGGGSMSAPIPVESSVNAQ